MICMQCGGTEFREDASPHKARWHGETYRVEGVTRRICAACGEVMMTADQIEREDAELRRLYRARHGLLAPEELAATRRALGLTQKEMEHVLGVSSPSVSRWETGSRVQPAYVDALYQVMREVPGAAAFLMQRAGVSSRVIEGPPVSAGSALQA